MRVIAVNPSKLFGFVRMNRPPPSRRDRQSRPDAFPFRWTLPIPAGTDPAAWRTLLIGKYGLPSKDSGSIDDEGLHARWCGQASCLGEGGVFRLSADVDAGGGTIALSQPEGTAQRLTALIEQEASRRTPSSAPAL